MSWHLLENIKTLPLPLHDTGRLFITMSKAIWKVIEAARGLGLKVISTADGDKVKIKGAAQDFPERLLALQLTLDALDKEGMKTQEYKMESVEREMLALREGVDELFKWLRENDIDIKEPYKILEISLKKAKETPSITNSKSTLKDEEKQESECKIGGPSNK